MKNHSHPMLLVATLMFAVTSCAGSTPGLMDAATSDQSASSVDAAGQTLEVVDTATNSDNDTGAPSVDGCPEEHPWIALPQSYSQFSCDLSDGTVCSWSAPGCAPGEKPNNTCTCSQYGPQKRFFCETPFHNCLPLVGTDAPDGTTFRRVPWHRSEAEVCASTESPRVGDTCTHSRAPSGNAEDTCATDEDCDDGSRCLDSCPIDQWTDGGTLCECYFSNCQEDEDCGDGHLCKCGVTANGQGTPCGGFFGSQCMHRCLPSTCRTDTDCGEGGYCSPSMDVCGWQAVSYHCHHPSVPECLTNWECFDELCLYTEGEGWICHEQPACD